jgi:hypothetical protein
MPADYTVVQSSAVTLDAANPSNTYPIFAAAAAVTTRSAILVIRVGPMTSAGPVTLEWELNNTTVLTTTFNSWQGRTFHVTVNPNILQTANNTLVATRIGPGDISISNVYILFHA